MLPGIMPSRITIPSNNLTFSGSPEYRPDLSPNGNACIQPAPRKKLETLTEQMFYVLLALREERHGYGIMQAIAELTGGRVSVGAGTLYALLERFEKDGLIRRTRTEDNRKYYILMPEGERTLQNEYERIKKQAADMERVLQKEEES